MSWPHAADRGKTNVCSRPVLRAVRTAAACAGRAPKSGLTISALSTWCRKSRWWTRRWTAWPPPSTAGNAEASMCGGGRGAREACRQIVKTQLHGLAARVEIKRHVLIEGFVVETVGHLHAKRI